MTEDLDRWLRMPLCFGPAPGPRNLPREQRHLRFTKDIHSVTLAAHSDGAMLQALLPAGLALAGEPRIEVVFTAFRNIGWLAGRGYDIVMVRIPATWRESGEQVSGHFVPVVWENMADPIITGREELGWAKIYGDIAQETAADGAWTGQASWYGHTFLSASAAGFAPAAPPAPAAPMVFHKYVPRTGHPGTADVDCLTRTAPDGPAPAVVDCATGSGTFAFHAARWEDMPTQYPIVNGLAALPLHGFLPVTRTHVSGGGDGSGQRELVVD
jgi:Acetoacetate decarboxylase (ADC)